MDLHEYQKFSRADSGSYASLNGADEFLSKAAYFTTYEEFVNFERDEVILCFKFNEKFTPDKEDFVEAIRELGNMKLKCTVVSKEDQGLYVQLNDPTEILHVHNHRSNT